MAPKPCLALALACAGGLGLLRPAPGTWGTLGAAMVAYPVILLTPAPWVPLVFAGLALVASGAGIAACPAAIRHWKCEDPSQVVIDEVAGLWVALAVIPAGITVANPIAVLIVSFLMFRVFDIIKPWPVSALERLPCGWGIMADDLAAGVLAGLTTAAVMR